MDISNVILDIYIYNEFVRKTYVNKKTENNISV